MKLVFIAALTAVIVGFKSVPPTQPFLHFMPLDATLVGQRPVVEGASDSEIVMFDDLSKSLHIIKSNGENLTTGELGTADGQVFEPSAMAINANRLVDVEVDTQRVQWFDTQGKFLHSCHLNSLWDTRTAALNDKNELIINFSQNDKPILILNDRCEVISSLGNRALVSQLYSTTNTSRDIQYKDAANRVLLAADGNDVIAVSLIAPVITKYSAAGKILFQRNLDHTVDQVFWNYSPLKGGMSTGIDGTQVPLISRGVAIDSETHHIYVLAARDLSGTYALYELYPDGQVALTFPYTSEFGSGAIYGMSVFQRQLYVSLVFADGAYRSTLPKSTK